MLKTSQKYAVTSRVVIIKSHKLDTGQIMKAKETLKCSNIKGRARVAVGVGRKLMDKIRDNVVLYRAVSREVRWN